MHGAALKVEWNQGALILQPERHLALLGRHRRGQAHAVVLILLVVEVHAGGAQAAVEGAEALEAVAGGDLGRCCRDEAEASYALVAKVEKDQEAAEDEHESECGEHKGGICFPFFLAGNGGLGGASDGGTGEDGGVIR